MCCRSRQQAEQIKARLAEWLQPRGLAINEDKTRIVHLSEGFDFLGFNIRRYGAKLLIKPSTAAIRRLRNRLARRHASCAARTPGRSSPGSTRSSVVGPPTTGSGVQQDLLLAGRLPVELTYKWAKHSHPNKSKTWLVDRYFGKFNKFRNDRWVFGDPALVSAQARRRAPAQVLLDEHRPAPDGQRHGVPDDPALIDYWAARRRRIKPPLDSYTLHLLDRQDSRCPLCGDPVLAADQPPTLTPALGELVAGGHPQGHPARLPRAPRTARTTRQSGR